MKRLIISLLVVFTGCSSAVADDTPKSCGGPQGGVCPEGQYCEYPIGSCGSTGDPGVCASVPEMCTLEYSPVCGCDGVTYGNPCAAKMKSVSIKSKGECPGAPLGKGKNLLPK